MARRPDQRPLAFRSVAPTDQRPSRARTAGGTLIRLAALIAIVAVVGVGLGFAVGYPVSKIDVSAESAVSLDHAALAGTFDPEAALVEPSDLPDNWQPADPAFAKFSMIGSPICGQAPEIPNPLGDKLVRVYQDDRNQGFVISEVVRVRQPKDANQYVREIEKAFVGCKAFFRSTGDDRAKVNVLPGQPDPPVTEYVSRSLSPVSGGNTQRVVFFQVADVIVAVQYAGPTTPARSLLGKAQREILTRLAPKQFTTTRRIPGAQPIPTEPTTSTSTSTTLPPTTVPATSTTVKRKRKPTSTTAKPTPTTAAAPAAPAPGG